MANTPPELKYSKTHEWVRVDGDTATIGITDHAQSELGDIVYLGLPDAGKTIKLDETFGEIESVKAVSELFAPLTGEVMEANTGIASTTELVNEDPYGTGWLLKVKVSNPSELSELMNADDYEKFADANAH
jgi:glycine cleavage system H protein